MKKSFKLILAGVLMGAICTACDKPKQQQESEGTDVSFTRYASSEDVSLKWVNLDDVEMSKSKILIINSDEELANHVEESYSPVDFSKKTLILAYGLEGYQNRPDVHDFQNISEQNYMMTVYLRHSLAAAILEWRVAILVDKLGEGSKVELKVTASPIDR